MVSEKYDVITSRRADKMLLSHTEFLAQMSPAAAQRMYASYKKAISLLKVNPFQFPFADELDAPDIPPEMFRKCLFFKRYKALYLVEGSTVYIDAIIDCRQENNNLF